MQPFFVKTEEEFNIIYHSYRMKIITAFSQCENQTATFKQIGDMLGDHSSKVTYHGKMLIKIGLLSLDHTENIHGITAKYYRLVSESFRVQYGKDGDSIVKKKIMKHQATIVLDSLDEMIELVSDLNNDNRSIQMASNDLYLTEEERIEMIEFINRFAQKKEKRANTKKVTCYSLIVEHKNEK
ncbi:hypothetical protein SANA_21300 [Gottschalkiaceae bacterium SANA]|nr:hypothetical protein SANA_21300 [Gottschalkiaceae bacterium SANA]